MRGDPPRCMKVWVEVRTSDWSPRVPSMTASPDGTIRLAAYDLMKSHSPSERKPDRTRTSGRSDAVVISTIFVSECSPSSATLGIGTLNLCPIRTPGHRNWPPVYSHRAAPGPSWAKSAPERTGPPLVVKRRHGFGWKSYADVDTIWST